MGEAAPDGLTSERPMNVTPSSTLSRLALMSPVTRALDFISMRSLATTLPWMVPSMVAELTARLPLIVADLPITVSPVQLSSPSSLPSMRTLPVLLMVPVISTSAAMTD